MKKKLIGLTLALSLGLSGLAFGMEKKLKIQKKKQPMSMKQKVMFATSSVPCACFGYWALRRKGDLGAMKKDVVNSAVATADLIFKASTGLSVAGFVVTVCFWDTISKTCGSIKNKFQDCIAFAKKMSKKPFNIFSSNKRSKCWNDIEAERKRKEEEAKKALQESIIMHLKKTPEFKSGYFKFGNENSENPDIEVVASKKETVVNGNVVELINSYHGDSKDNNFMTLSGNHLKDSVCYIPNEDSVEEVEICEFL